VGIQSQGIISTKLDYNQWFVTVFYKMRVFTSRLITITRPTRIVRSRLSPTNIDMITIWSERSFSTSILLGVFLFGKFVIDAAEKTLQEHEINYNSDDDSE
jgi:hypothetical protein